MNFTALSQDIGKFSVMMKAGNSHVGGTYMVLTAALYNDWLPKDGPADAASQFLAGQIRECLDVWVSLRSCANMEDAAMLCLREKQQGTVGLNKMTILEWRVAFERSVRLLIDRGEGGRRTRAELLVLMIDAHQKKERNSRLKIHTDDVAALKNFSNWPDEVFRVFEAAFSRGSQDKTCWHITCLKQALFDPRAQLDCNPSNTLWVD